MPSPWDDKQHPEQKSKFHGRKDHDHGPHEHGMGGKVPPGHNKPAAEDPDASGDVPEGALVDVDGQPLAGLTTYPSSLYIHHAPPVSNQGMSSRCVTHASASDQQQQDRPEYGKYFRPDFGKFAARIGTTSSGAFISVANEERINRGFPEDDATPHAGGHRIKRAIELEQTVNALKAAFAHDHGVLNLFPWFHSWYHPLASGKLPAPDYFVGYHEIYGRGYNDNYGIRLRNSWGIDWGIAGDCFLPYAHIWRAVIIHRTVDV